jgi:hypothetical protein
MTTRTPKPVASDRTEAGRKKTTLAGRPELDPLRFAVEEVPVPSLDLARCSSRSRPRGCASPT